MDNEIDNDKKVVFELKPYTRKANFYETDQMGIIHHSNYIRWFEEARVCFMEQIGYGYEQATAVGIDFAVLSAACEYKSMVHFGETVKIYMEISDFTPMRMTVKYKVVDIKTDEIRATGETKHCFYHNQRKHPVSMKKELPELYELFASIAVQNKGIGE